MQCIRPVNIINPEPLLVPCRVCLPCRMAKTNEWKNRLVHEAQYYVKVMFISLTYKEEALKDELEKDEWRLFVKRLRKQTSESIKYLACGEYGDDGRPHYHAIIFGVGIDDHKKRWSQANNCYYILEGPLNEAWKKGFISGGYFNPERAAYCVKYIFKQDSRKNWNKQEPFRMQSQGLGKRYAIENRDQLIENMCITVEGKKSGLPRYYTKVLTEYDSELQLKINQRAEEKASETLEDCHSRGIYGEKVLEEIKRAALQREKNTIAKRGNYGKPTLR